MLGKQADQRRAQPGMLMGERMKIKLLFRESFSIKKIVGLALLALAVSITWDALDPPFKGYWAVLAVLAVAMLYALYLRATRGYLLAPRYRR